MTLNEPVPWDPLQPVSNCRNASKDLDFMLVIQIERAGQELKEAYRLV